MENTRANVRPPHQDLPLRSLGSLFKDGRKHS